LNNSDRYTNVINIVIGKNVRAMRLKRGLTIEELAEAADLNVPFISKIERGLATCSIITVFKLAYGLGISSGLLIDEAEKLYSEYRDKEKEDPSSLL